VIYSLLSRLSKDEEFEEEVMNNPEENVFLAFERKFNTELQGMLEEHFDFYKKLNNDPEIRTAMMQQMFKVLYVQMARRASLRCNPKS